MHPKLLTFWAFSIYISIYMQKELRFSRAALFVLYPIFHRSEWDLRTAPLLRSR